MAQEAPLYRQQLDIPQAPQATVQPIQAPIPDQSGIGAAMAAFGQQAVSFLEKKQTADNETASLTARADHAVALQKLEDDYKKDPDYINAPKKFAAERERLDGEALQKVPDPRAQAGLRMNLTVRGLSSQNQVDQTALAKQNSSTIGALEADTEDAVNRAAAAGSPRERQALVQGAYASIDAALNGGAITAQQAYARKHMIDYKLDSADVARDMRTDPARTVQMLNDPSKYRTLPPADRENFKTQALQAHDNREVLRSGEEAKRDPTVAAARFGLVTTRGMADDVYSRAIIPIESDGNPNVISPKGAIGLGQLMPATAREKAAQLGMTDIAMMDDASLMTALKNPSVNMRIGSAYWADQVSRYGGNVFAAAAAYNAGPSRADKWHKQARDQFGDHYSASQLASLIPIDETRNYVLKVSGRLGIDPGAPPVSFRASYSGAGVVSQQFAQQANQQRQMDNAIIAIGGDERNATVKALNQGYGVDASVVERIRQPLIDAAARGNPDASAQLRIVDEAVQTKGFVEDLYRHTPEEVEAGTAALQATVAKTGGSPSELRRLDLMTKTLSAMSDARKNNPVGLVERQLGRSAVTFVAPPQQLDDHAFGSSLAMRAVTAADANRRYGGEFKFFKPEEAAALKPWFDGLDANGKVAAIGAVAANTSGAAREAAFRELTDGRPATMFAAGLFAKEPDIARSILQGMAGIDTYVPKGTEKTTYDVSKMETLPPAVFTGSSRLQKDGQFAAMSTAIDARYAFLAAQENDSSGKLNKTRLKQAADDVTGGVLEHNDKPLLAPQRGMTQRQFDETIWALSEPDLAGAQTSSGTAVTAGDLRGLAKLQTVTDGVYMLQLNRDDAKPLYAVTKAGAPFLLDLRNRKRLDPTSVLNTTALP